MASHWVSQSPGGLPSLATQPEPDLDMMEEIALAMAQSTVDKAIRTAEIKRADLARKLGRPRSFVTRILGGSHNLTIRTLARAIAACGFEVRFQLVPIQWQSLPVDTERTPTMNYVPAASAAGIPWIAPHRQAMHGMPAAENCLAA